MNWKAFWKLTFVFSVLIGAWTLITGSYSPIYGLSVRNAEAYLFRFPIPLPFLIEFLAAPILAFWIIASIRFDKKSEKKGGGGELVALVIFWCLSFVASVCIFAWLNTGVFFTVFLGTTSAFIVTGAWAVFFWECALLGKWIFS